MRAGTVPVVLGAPNIERFDPLYNTDSTKKSYIHANQFKPKDLAIHLKNLMNNRTAYEELLEWKSSGIGDEFRWFLNQRYSHEGACNMCKAVAYIKKMQNAM